MWRPRAEALTALLVGVNRLTLKVAEQENTAFPESANHKKIEEVEVCISRDVLHLIDYQEVANLFRAS
ncbi:hypothetical protein ASF88_12475 [Leifsonia sp. Leaf336]|nr:hypothetical protein ASF88_12475 [Leifsonia sp. Leaf336]